MKKLLIIALATVLVACSSGINVDELMMKMPKNDRTFLALNTRKLTISLPPNFSFLPILPNA